MTNKFPVEFQREYLCYHNFYFLLLKPENCKSNNAFCCLPSESGNIALNHLIMGGLMTNNAHGTRFVSLVFLFV